MDDDGAFCDAIIWKNSLTLLDFYVTSFNLIHIWKRGRKTACGRMDVDFRSSSTTAQFSGIRRLIQFSSN